MAKRILVLYTSIGLGHKSIAENIAWHLQREGFTVRLEDVLKVQEGRLVNVSKKLHAFINKHLPFLWSWLYHSTNSWLATLTVPLRMRVAAQNYRELLAVVRGFRPDVIISTQTTASAIVSYLKERGFYQGLFGVAFSDFHLHKFWLYKNADLYLANIIEQKTEMVRLGIAEEKIFVCGMTLQPKPSVDRDAVRQKLGVGPHEKVILMASGSLGIGFNDRMLQEAARLPGVRLVVVCGKNRQLQESLAARYATTKAIVVGFYTPMDDLYALADLFITKPGGLTVAESLRWQLPLLVAHMLPGQEELNFQYLSDKHLIIPGQLSISLVKHELDTGEFRKQLASNAVVKDLVEAPGLAEAVALLHGHTGGSNR